MCESLLCAIIPFTDFIAHWFSYVIHFLDLRSNTIALIASLLSTIFHNESSPIQSWKENGHFPKPAHRVGPFSYKTADVDHPATFWFSIYTCLKSGGEKQQQFTGLSSSYLGSKDINSASCPLKLRPEVPVSLKAFAQSLFAHRFVNICVYAGIRVHSSVLECLCECVWRRAEFVFHMAHYFFDTGSLTKPEACQIP